MLKIMSGFLNIKGLKCRSTDGRNFILLEYLYYRTEDGRLLRSRTTTDGISTPAFVWVIIPPFGRIWWSGIIHDGCYRDSIEVWDVQAGWIPWHPTEAQSDSLIFEAMKSQNARYLMRFIIYMNLRWFGWRAFGEDRKTGQITSQRKHNKRVRAINSTRDAIKEHPLEQEIKKSTRGSTISGVSTFNAQLPGLPSPEQRRPVRRAPRDSRS